MRAILWKWAPLLVVLLLGFAAGVWFGPGIRPGFVPTNSSVPTTGTKASTGSTVRALGKLRPADGLLSVVGPPGDRVKEIKVKEGQPAKAGDPLVILASADDIQEEVILAQKQLDEANHTLEAIERARKARLAEVITQLDTLAQTEKLENEGHDVKIDLLERQLESSRAQQERVARLDSSVVRVSAQEREQLGLLVTKARGELKAAELARDATKQKADLQRKSAETQRKVIDSESDLARDRVAIESRKQALVIANRKLARSTLKAPVDGVVLRIVTPAGDAITAQPILQMRAGSKMVAQAEVYAADIGKIRDWLQKEGGVTAEISSPALGEVKFRGAVTHPEAIAQIVARNLVSGFSPRADSDRRVIEVRVDLEDADKAQEFADPREAQKFVGLEVNVKFEPKSKNLEPAAPR